jgi:hypothetical protein
MVQHKNSHEEKWNTTGDMDIKPRRQPFDFQQRIPKYEL